MKSMESKRKKGKIFVMEFALMAGMMVAIAVVATALVSKQSINTIIQDYRTTSNGYDSFILRMFAKSFHNDLKNGNFKETEEIYNFASREDYINYAFIYDTKTGEIIWSSDSKNFNKLGAYELLETVVPTINYQKNLNLKETDVDNYKINIGFGKTKSQDEAYHNKMILNLQILAPIFILLCFILSIFLGTKLNKPLMDLVAGVLEFGSGNLHNKLKETGFEEIDNLVFAYNKMASQLLDLYESLETKVEERTKELEDANTKLKEAQTMMVHSEKMRSLGELVAGIAHEINNPINFIYGNIMILDNYQQDLMKLVDKYTSIEKDIPQNEIKDISEFKQKIDFEFLRDDIGDLIKSCIEGVERTKNIIIDLKNFSRMDERLFSECDLSKEIDTTLNILNNKIKNRITIHREYEDNLPKIEAYGGQLNQVFMNILDNAQSAIKGMGDIYIKIYRKENNIVIQFKDTGVGIKEENLHKVFEPFFTTKPVGQGTGLGMSIAYKVIQSHNGKITVDSEVGKGTTFTIVLPIEHKGEEQ